MARDLVLEVVEQVRGNALGEAKRDLDQVADATDNAAESARDYTAELKAAEQQIEATKLKIKALGAEFVATGDKAIGKDLRGERSLLGQLSKIREELEDAAGGGVGVVVGTAAGQGFAGGFMQSIGGLGSNIRGAMIPTLIAGVAAFAPAIGAVVSGAIVGVVGAGGIAGGIAAASRDPGVRAEATHLGGLISEKFFGSGASVAEPLRRTLQDLGDTVKGLDLETVFRFAAPAVEILGRGVSDLVNNLMPGLNTVMYKSVPIATVLADGFGNIGDAVSDMLFSLMQSEGTLEGLEVTFLVLGDAIRFTGEAGRVLGDAFHEINAAAEPLAHGMASVYHFLGRIFDGFEQITGLPLASWLHGIADRFTGIGDRAGHLAGTNERLEKSMHQIGAATALMNQGLDPFAAYLADAEENARNLKYSLDSLFGVQMSVDQATIAWQKSLDDLSDSVKRNGTSLDITTRGGQNNALMLLSMVQAAQAAAQATYDSTHSQGAANAQYHAAIVQLQALAVQLGLDKAAVERLAGNYQITVTTTYKTIGKGPSFGGGMYLGSTAWAAAEYGHAAGGEPRGWEPFWAGEDGPELMRLLPTPKIYPHGVTPSMARSDTHTSGGGGFDHRALASAFREALHGATLTIDDRTGRTAHLYSRGG